MNLQQAKGLFFAQYLGQPVLRCISRPNEIFKVLPYDCTPSETTNFLLLRTVEQLTDEERIQIARFAHQLPDAKFTIEKGKGITYLKYTDHIGITHFISMLDNYATICAQNIFPEDENNSRKQGTGNN